MQKFPLKWGTPCFMRQAGPTRGFCHKRQKFYLTLSNGFPPMREEGRVWQMEVECQREASVTGVVFIS